MTASVADLTSCATSHLDHYLDPAGPRAFHAYDLLGDEHRLEPGDLLAPALLDAPLRGAHVIAMHRPDGPYAHLRVALQGVLDDLDGRTARFEDQDLEAAGGPWSRVKEALVASDSTPDIKASKVTKILHRKRPNLVPIFDSRVSAYYGVSTRAPWLFWPVLQADVLKQRTWLDELTAGRETPDRRPLSVLRAVDIVVWEHTMGCR